MSDALKRDRKPRYERKGSKSCYLSFLEPWSEYF